MTTFKVHYIVATGDRPHTSSQRAALYRAEGYRNRYVAISTGTFDAIQALADELNGDSE